MHPVLDNESDGFDSQDHKTFKQRLRQPSTGKKKKAKNVMKMLKSQTGMCYETKPEMAPNLEAFLHIITGPN